MSAAPIMEERYDDFDIWAGCLFLTCMAGPYTILGGPCFYQRMTTQEVYFEGNRLHFKYDCCLVKEDKLIPLDRIQDANIEATCCSRICGVSVLSIQTANGSVKPEASIIAPRDAAALRSMIMDRRDHIVHSTGSDGLGVTTQKSVSSNSSPLHSDVAQQELKSIRGVLERIEQAVDRGVGKFERMEVR